MLVRFPRWRLSEPMSGKDFLIQADNVASRDRWIAAVRTNSHLHGPGGGEAGSSAHLERDKCKNVISGGESNVALGDFELLKVIGRGS